MNPPFLCVTTMHPMPNRFLQSAWALIGQLSRIISPISSVTHDAVPFPPAPGQLTLAEVNQSLRLLEQLPKQSFHLVRSDPNLSQLVAMHNAGFEELGLPFSCGLHNTTQVGESLQEKLLFPDFGGAFIQDFDIPRIESLLDEVSPSAKTVRL